MEMAAVPSCVLVAVRHKAVLKHTQSRRWREVRCGPANAKRLDYVRFIAAVSRPHSTRSAAKIRREGLPTSGFGFSAWFQNPFEAAEQRTRIAHGETVGKIVPHSTT